MDPERQQKLDNIFAVVFAAAEEIRLAFGRGLPVRLYRECLVHELRLREVPLRVNVSVPVIYKEMRIDDGVTLDVIVDGLVPVVAFSEEELTPFHDRVMNALLTVSGLPMGILVNFSATSIRGGMRRIKNPNPRV